MYVKSNEFKKNQNQFAFYSQTYYFPHFITDVKVGDQHLKECGVDEPYCVDDMLADWVAKGQQLIQIKRGCSAVPAISPCVSGESSYMMV